MPNKVEGEAKYRLKTSSLPSLLRPCVLVLQSNQFELLLVHFFKMHQVNENAYYKMGGTSKIYSSSLPSLPRPCVLVLTVRHGLLSIVVGGGGGERGRGGTNMSGKRQF